jgi:putative chitinase
MSYEDVMNIVLPHQGHRAAHITGHYGERRANGPHGGSDFNYEGGQAGINLTHPTVHAPVSGEVTFVGGQYGTIKIRDAQGNSHEILHTRTQSVVVGQQLTVGDEIATMGGRGPHGATQYAQHVHYQMKDSHGHAVNPEQYWSQHPVQTPVSPVSKIASSSDSATTVLRQGAHGPAVHDLQASLSRLGYTGRDHEPLSSDSQFGLDTRHAVEVFQRDHHLTVDGKVGPQTQKALDAQIQMHAKESSLRLDNPANPDHALYEQARTAVHVLDAHLGRKPDQQSDQLAASLTVAARHEGMSRIDAVTLSSDGSHAFAVQGAPDSPLRQVAHVQTAQAVNTPIEQSSQTLAQLAPKPVDPALPPTLAAQAPHHGPIM